MFSSLSKYSPKNLLASYLSESLADFFDVDPERVEATLIRDAKVVLNDVEIKARRLGGGGGGEDRRLCASGRIERIEFSWAWDGSALIKDVVLAVRGVDVHVRVVRGENDRDATEGDCEETGPTEAEDAGTVDQSMATDASSTADWKARYMQQIIDHLTLAVSGVTVTFHIDEESRAVLEATDVELETTTTGDSRAEEGTSAALRQTIGLASVQVWMEQREPPTKFPILEPFGYRAGVARLSGRRFLDGISSGLLVEGEPRRGPSPRASPSAVRVHAGVRQVAGLNRLARALLLVPRGGRSAREETGSDVGDPPSGADPSVSVAGGTKSVFRLPFPSAEVLLENEAALKLEACRMDYCTDGSELSFGCSGGVWVDGEPLSKDGRWSLDFASSELVLESLPSREDCDGDFFFSARSDAKETMEGDEKSGDAPFRLDLNLDMFQKVYRGIQAIVPQYEEGKAVAGQSMVDRTRPSPSFSSWTLRSTSPVAFRFTGEDDRWVELSAKSPKLIQNPSSSDGAFSFESASIDVDSNVGLAIHIPRISTDDGGTFRVQHRASAVVDSMDTFKVLQAMRSQISDIVDGEPSSSGIPLNVSLPGFDIAMKDQHMSAINLSRISGAGAEWSVGLLQVNNVEEVTLDASSLRVTLEASTTTVIAQTIKRLAYGNVDYLAAPIANQTTIEVENDGTILVAVKDAYVKVPEVTARANKESGPTATTIPTAFHFTVEHLKAESSPAHSIDIDDLDIWLRPNAKLLMVDMGLKSIKANAKGMFDLSCGKINSSIEVNSGVGGSDVMLPGIGQLSSASMTVHDVVKMSSSAGHLSNPLDVVHVTYGAQTAMFKFNKVLFCVKHGIFAPESDDLSANQSSLPHLPIDVYFEANRFVAMEDFGPGKPGLCCDGLRVHLAPSATVLGINVQCHYIQCRGTNQLDIAGKGVKLMLSKNMSDNESDYLGLKKANLTMAELSTFSAPSQGLKLVKPIVNPVLQLKNKSIDVKCDVIQVSYDSPGKEAAYTEEDGVPPGLVDIPPFRFDATEFHLIIPSTKEMIWRQLSIQFMASAHKTSSKSLHIESASMNGKLGAGCYEVKGITLSTKWEEAGGVFTIPYLGSLSFAQAELEACSKITTSSFVLVEPVYKPKLLFQRGFLVLELSDVQLDVTKAFEDSHVQGKKEFNLDELKPSFLSVPIGINVSNKLRIRSTDLDVQFENLGVDYVPALACSKGELFIHGDRLVSRHLQSTIATKKFELHLHLSLSSRNEAGPLNTLIPSMDRVKKASLKMIEVTDLLVDGMIRLSQPLQKTCIVYDDGVFATDIGALQFQCLFSEQNLTVGVKELNVRVQPDPFDSTLRFTMQGGTISGHGSASFGAAGINLVATIVPSTVSDEVFASKPITIPRLGYVSLVVLDIAEVTILNIPGVGHLKSPITKLAIRFGPNLSGCDERPYNHADILSLDCPGTVFFQRVTNKAVSSTRKDHPPCQLPCKACISIESVQLCEQNRKLRCRHFNLTMDPLNVCLGQAKESIRGPGLGFQVIGSSFNSVEGSTVIDISRLSVSGLLQLNDLAAVGNLAIGIEKAQLAAEFSSSKWSGSLEEGHHAVIKLPYASIPKFDMTLHCVGNLLNINDATIACDAFQGGVNTTLSQLQNHYVSVLKSRIPFLLAKTDIAGCNVGDSVGVMAGKVLTHTSVVGATLGIASRDAVGSTLTMGKASRGADSSEKYKIGDFSRGVVSSIKHAAKTGTDIRGDDSYQVGDFTSGAAKSAGNYTTENRCRLAGAGGSAFGMAAGAALLGPVGFVAGSVIGGSAAKSSMAALTGDPKKEPQPTRQSQGSGNQPNVGAQPQSQQARDSIPSAAVHHVAQAPYQQHFSRASAPPRQPTMHSGSVAQLNRPNIHNPPRLTAQASYQQQISQARNPHGMGAAQPNQNSPNYAHNAAHQSNAHEGYRFGDVTRSIIDKGKKANGRDDSSGYKFGDFTRGLFK